ncbi:flagellar hook-basal body complex protein FliE [Clostridium estertheticum]|uniref:flagellar hook-basal body complex protein FliE n=1 Tax=Clostridium estertheticum TaxID=238834 RepID=UPI001C6ED1D5|nr:flagellar hook-basal body complex protein FliE [Clostridium estertheticum]MBW9151946.1 flagellar hook-basal body complex protein FliE [Clostridium estertheticum]MBW9170652.1 flagellar hook-basal body complex protein FliE [Clostridium estertheticum]MBX4269218.1 flagellar hook-basal body complex protein FliE [Clostridium estertheticum]MCB2359358.1 flagellar hook-basal body complex protein FliE [Clostridium estertheticum]WLC74502.1 flagellar hook-basal body complex protein FliE [Clostridium es
MNINASANVSNTAVLNDVKTDAVNNENSGTSFLDTLKEKLDGVNDKQIESDDLTQKFIKGDETDVQKVMLSTAEAKLSLETAVQIRNKLVDAYDVFNRMQI